MPGSFSYIFVLWARKSTITQGPLCWKHECTLAVADAVNLIYGVEHFLLQHIDEKPPNLTSDCEIVH